MVRQVKLGGKYKQPVRILGTSARLKANEIKIESGLARKDLE